jgi:Flp pilus assembly protein TadB
MSSKKRYGDPRKNQAQESSKQAKRRSKRELSAGFIAIAWIVFFVLWLVAGFLVAAIVFGALLLGGIGALSMT